MDNREELKRMRRHLAELEERLSWEREVSASLESITRCLLSPATIEEISRQVLEHAQRLTGSRLGYVGYLDPETGNLVCPTLSGEIWDRCEVQAKRTAIKDFSGLFGWVLENRKPILTNHPQGDPRSSGTPKGHLPIMRFLSAPALSGETLAGQIALANADRDYTMRDLALVEKLADFYALAVLGERSREALADSEERYRRIYDYTGEAIYTYDTGFVLIGVNRKACELIGYSEEELLGHHILELNILHPEDYERTYRDIQRLFRGEVVQDELRFITRDGSVILGDITGAPLYGRNGETVAFTNVARDITERRRAEEELQRINRELDAYAYVVSHDLRGPLSAIVSAASVLGELAQKPWDSRVGARVRQLAGIISRSADSAEELILNLLSLAKAGQAPEKAAGFAASEVVREVLRDRAALIAEAGADVRVDEDLGELYADHTQMYQLFANLIDNALEHNDSEEPCVIVSHLGSEGGIHRYLVRDNGSGIPSGDSERIFELLYRGKSGGTGIGLSTVKKIIDAYGGEIKAYNDGGACFEFTLHDWRNEP